MRKIRGFILGVLTLLIFTAASAPTPAAYAGRIDHQRKAKHEAKVDQHKAKHEASVDQHKAKHEARVDQHKAKHEAREEKREARREAKESPGAFHKMKRFFGFGQSDRKRSDHGAEHERGSGHRGNKTDG